MENNEKLRNGRIENVDIEKEMKKSYLAYSMSVIVGRALPDVRDGLKPVHRRILYTMYEKGLTPEKAYRKCADIIGSVLGRYHPHGDASVYDALVRLAQEFSMRYPTVDGHGNFGSVDGHPAAAYRYTEAKMSKIAMEMVADIEKDTVQYTSNYDDRLKEPVTLTSRFPNLLVNGSTGIAVGMATNIPPHNLREVTNAICMLIDNPDANLLDIMEHIKGPDFPTGGIIMGHSGIRAAYATGRGKITLRSRTEIEEHKPGRFQIVVSEIPYMVNKTRLMTQIADLVRDKRVEGISYLADQSDRDGIRIVIEVKKDYNAEVILNQLFRYTQLQDTVGVILLALVNGEPKVLNLKEILQNYIEYQQLVIRRRTEYDLRKAMERAHILKGLTIALDFIDEVIRIIRGSKDQPSAKKALMERCFKPAGDEVRMGEVTLVDYGEDGVFLDDSQASAIVAMRLGQLSGLERQKIENEYIDIIALIQELEGILADEQKILAIIKEELLSITKKFGDARRTEICAVSGEVDIEDLIPVEDCVVTYTHYGYIKRQPVDVYKTQRRGGRGVAGMKQRDNDFVTEMFICSTHDNVLFLSNLGKMYKLKGYEIAEGGRNAKGINIVNLLDLEEGENITAMIKAEDFSEEKFLVMVTNKGIIKRTNLSAYKNVRSRGLKAIHLDEGDHLAGVRLTNGDSELIIGTKNGMAIRFAEAQVRALSRTARGVKAITLREDDEVVGMARIRKGAYLMTITDRGQGRRTSLDAYRTQYRGGFGLKNYKVTEEKGHVCGIKVVDETDDIILITSDGIIIRTQVSEINVMSRYASGVRVMRLTDDAKVVTFIRAVHEEEEAEPSSENTEEQENYENHSLEDETEATETNNTNGIIEE